MRDEHAVLDKDLNPIFTGTWLEVLEWLEENYSENSKAVSVRIGMRKMTVDVQTYMRNGAKRAKKVPQPKRKTRKQIVLELLQELLSIDTEMSNESLDDLAEEYADKIVRLYSERTRHELD